MCRHLERLYQHTVSNETAGEARLAALIANGWDLVLATWPAIASSLEPTEVPCRLVELLDGAAAEAFARHGHCHRLVAALLRQGHVRALAGALETEPTDFVALLSGQGETEGLVLPEARAARAGYRVHVSSWPSDIELTRGLGGLSTAARASRQVLSGPPTALCLGLGAVAEASS